MPRVGVFVVLVAFVGANLAVRLHQIVQEHVRCAEHGEMIHVAGADPSADPLAAPAVEERGPEDPESSVGPYAPVDNEHEHEHCQLVLPSRKHQGALAHASFVHDARVEVLPWLPVHVAERPRDPLYSLAPKTSPPA